MMSRLKQHIAHIQAHTSETSFGQAMWMELSQGHLEHLALVVLAGIGVFCFSCLTGRLGRIDSKGHGNEVRHE